MNKHLPRFHTNTYCPWIDEGTGRWGGGGGWQGKRERKGHERDEEENMDE